MLAKIIAGVVIVAFFSCGCRGLKPSVTAGYYIENLPESKSTIVLGSNNTQANAIHSALPTSTAETSTAEADNANQTARSSGLFVNNTVGSRSADIDATAALETLRNVQSSTASQSATRGDTSPNTTTQTPTTTDTHEKTTTPTVNVGQ